ncbi:uncharacterized protein A4U43_C09F7200 [Asparagus officinalis]|uniref:PHD-type domain-containing protein n=1 Tax=Asparagus officinalis TaxID=4686 RepID=A0A5P1E635_ASPOF|nr:uncharacterized protein LOC109824734 isoform X2 [Asparagus officinalis]ONK58028.1 uncharacterized protein A4U43_C09F7200 [Asparagus officinalis]
MFQNQGPVESKFGSPSDRFNKMFLGKTAGENLEDGKVVSEEERMRMLFGKEVALLEKDEVEGSKVEHQISMEILYQTNCDDKHSNSVLSEALKDTDELEGNAVSAEDMTGNSSGVCRQVPCRIVETLGHSIVSSLHLASVPIKIDTQTDPLPNLEEIRRSLVNQRAKDLKYHGKMDSGRLRSNAYNLLTDVGWKIKTHKRKISDNVDFIYTSPGGDRVYSISKAWVMCGKGLYAKAPDSRYDEIGRKWFNIDELYVDMMNTLDFLEKETLKLSHLLRWQLLDPFVAVVCMDRKITFLRRGKALRAVNSSVSIINGSENIIMNTKGAPFLVTDGKYEVSEYCNKQAPGDAYVHCRSLKSLARHIGQGFSCTRNSEHIKGKASATKKRNQASKSGFSNKSQSYALRDTEVSCSNKFIDCTIQDNMAASNPNEIPSGIQPCKYMKIDEGGLSQDSTIIRGNNVRKVLNFEEIDKTGCCLTPEAKPKYSNNELRQEESKQEIQLNTILSGDTSTSFVLNQTPVHSQQEEQVLYLYPLQETLCFNTADGTEEVNMPQVTQPFLYQPSLAGTFFIYSIDSRNLTNNMNFSLQHEEYHSGSHEYRSLDDNVASSSKKPKSRRQKKSKKISEIEAMEAKLSGKNYVEAFVHDRVAYIEFSAPHKENIKLRSSNLEDSLKVQSGKYDVTEAVSLKKKRKRPAKSETTAARRNRKVKDTPPTPLKDESGVTMLKFDTEQENVAARVLNDRVIQSISNCENNPIVDVGLVNGEPLANKYDGDEINSAAKSGWSRCYRKRKSRTRGSNYSLQTTEDGGNQVALESRTILCWLIERKVISLNDTIEYRNSLDNAAVKKGLIRRNGILCLCCDKIFCVSDFKFHAGFEMHKPSFNLFLDSMKTYTLCEIEAWSAEYKARKGSMPLLGVEERDQNDDVCTRCGDGGELVCCDGCPSSYHRDCLPSEDLPEGSWYCPHCVCPICRDVITVMEPSTSSVAFSCLQCEHKYHQTCRKGKDLSEEEVGSDSWFCGEICQEVYMGLQSRIGEMICIGDGFYRTILKCNHDDQKIHSAQKIALMAECHAKLAVALTIMEECFMPMIDPRTGINMIPHILYNWGLNFTRLNYQGFYTVVLEKGDELISVASIRVHGVTVAEMPLIATGTEHRHQGMCRRLMSAIEEMLKSLKVEMLVLSAIPDLADTWVSGFGFQPIEDSEKRRLNKISLLSFPGTVLLQKTLREGTVTKENDSLESEDKAQDCAELDESTRVNSAERYSETVREHLECDSEITRCSNVESCNKAVRTVGTSNTCEMKEAAPREQGPPDSLLYQAIANGLPTDKSLKETNLPIKEDKTPNAHIDHKDNASDTQEKERSLSPCEDKEAERVCTLAKGRP